MKFDIRKDYLDQYTIFDSFNNQIDGTFNSLQDAREKVESLTSDFERSKNTCAWNGHELGDEPVANVENRFGTDTVCQSHQGLLVKSISALAEKNPTVRGNSVR